MIDYHQPLTQSGLDITDQSRLSNVDGYTVVRRTDHSPRVHLLRPWNQCNTEKSKSGADTLRIEGSREVLMEHLQGRSAAWCRWCFRSPTKAQLQPEVTEELVYADPIEEET